MPVLTEPQNSPQKQEPSGISFLSALIACVLTAIATFMTTIHHYDPVIEDLQAEVSEYKTKSRTKHFEIYTRKAISMEDRTTRFIVAPDRYALNDCVWVNNRGIVCDTCIDATMYMLLEGPRKDSITN